MEIGLGEDFGAGDSPVRAGLVVLQGLAWDSQAAASRLADEIARVLVRVRGAGEAFLAPARKTAVRDMLRHGTYKPAGRAKPSSEYLLQAALEGDFPSVNPFVDAVNCASLEFGYPASIVDLAKAGTDLLLRHGRNGESYVFNAGGQSIDLRDLLCLCRMDAGSGAWKPCANPVRDSMDTKLFPGAGAALVVFYAPSGVEGAQLGEACARTADLLSEAARDIVVVTE